MGCSVLENELSKFFSGGQPPDTTAKWLRRTYFAELLDIFNTSESRRRLGIYGGEKIPENERNLTDVRNRVSLIIEYETARLSNDILETFNGSSFFWSYVVANRFPDLEVRKADGTRSLRVEIKCLQSIAEEKSANFDTLIKDLNPNTDFVVVFLWEWEYPLGRNEIWDRAPKILRHYVFNAYSLASLRDCYWLNKPHSNLGDGFQGFDLRYAVNSNHGLYSQEEGNYGKLTRIWSEDFPHRPATTPAVTDTESEYLKFKREVIEIGFWSLCNQLLPIISGDKQTSPLEADGVKVGEKASRYAFFLKSLIDVDEANQISIESGCDFMVIMTDKYLSTGYEVRSDGATRTFHQLKPKAISSNLFDLS